MPARFALHGSPGARFALSALTGAVPGGSFACVGGRRLIGPCRTGVDVSPTPCFAEALADSASANRKTLMVLGAFLQGLFTCLLPTASAWAQGSRELQGKRPESGDIQLCSALVQVPLVALGALNALAKASLRPVSFGLIAEASAQIADIKPLAGRVRKARARQVTREFRGSAFGVLFAALYAGGTWRDKAF